VTCVIDSSALLAYLRAEPGAETIRDQLSQCLVSSVIYAETLGKAATLGMDRHLIDRALMRTGLRVVEADAETARKVADLFELSRQRISLAGRFCLALALERNLPVITGDRIWQDLGLDLEVRLFR
jgi:ribonuclease VapC